MAKRNESLYVRTARRSFLRPPAGSVFSLSEVPLIIDAPAEVVRQAASRGRLRTFEIDGAVLVDGTELVRFVQEWDRTVASAAKTAQAWPDAA